MRLMMTTVLLIEDDPAIIQATTIALHKWNYKVATISDWCNLINDLQRINPQLVLMDITLPTFDGFYWTQQIREVSNVPIIFISAAPMDPNAVRAIAIGADDYLVKPFTSNVLIAKIQAVLRRNNITQELTFENYRLSILKNELVYQQQVVKLTPTEGVILRLLFINANQTVTKEQFLQALWQGGAFVDENILKVNISRLRNKLSKVNLSQQLITERKRGYRLISHD